MEEISLDTCRICILKMGDVSIYEKRIDVTTIADMIMEMTSVTINFNENIPSCVCFECAERVESAYKLKQDCEKSDFKLRQYFTEKKNQFALDDVKPPLDFCQQDLPVDVEIEIKKELNEEDLLSLSVAAAVAGANVVTADDPQQIFQEHQHSEQQETQESHEEQQLNHDPQHQSQTITLIPTGESDDTYSLVLDTVDETQTICEEKAECNSMEATELTEIESTHTISSHSAMRSSSPTIKKPKSKSIMIPTIGEEPLAELQCEYCDKKFQFRASLSNHLRVHKGKTSTPHVCNVCGKEFKLRQNLNNHIRTHTGEKPFECDICLKKFSTRSNVFNHRRTHSDEKPYVCDVCGKQFPTISHLRNHNLSHVPISERKYKCEKCNKTFRDRKIFKRHLNIHNGIRNEMCEICGKKFCNKNDVTRHHKTVHLGIKKYVCSVCGKAFSNSSNLESHFRIHTGEKPFECKYCDAKFNQSTPLVKHTKLHVERGDQMKFVAVVQNQN